MTRYKRIALGAAAAALAAGLVTAALALAGGGEAPTQVPPKSTFSVSQARAFTGQPLYYAGELVDGLPLVAVLRDRRAEGDVVSFIYGDCIAVADTGCAPPAEVQVWPACMRSLALYDTPLPGAPAPVRTTYRGVPAVFVDEARQLEIHTGSSVVVVFSDTQNRVGRIASALRGLNVATPPKAPLPPPAQAIDGKLRC